MSHLIINNQKSEPKHCCFVSPPHVLHRGAGVHARPSVSAADVSARGDAALTHAAPEGWMSRRLSQRLELSVSPCAKLHIKNAPFKREEEEGKKKEQRDTFISLSNNNIPR